MILIDSEPEEFKNALLDAYPSRNELAQMLYYRLKKRLSAIADGDDLEEIIFQLIVKAEAQGWIEQLVIAAYEYNPENEPLKSFYQIYILKHGVTALPIPSKNSARQAQQSPKGESVSGKRITSKPKTTKRAHPSQRSDSASSSPDKFLTQANKYLKKAQLCTRKGARLFQAMDKYGFTLVQYKEALELPKHLQENLDTLYALVDRTSPFPEIVTANYQQSISKQQLISKIDLIVEQVEVELTPSLDDEDLPYKDIQEKFQNLEQMLEELHPLFQAGSLPAQVRIMKSGISQERNPDKPFRRNHRTSSSFNRFAEMHYTSPLTSDLRNQLIGALLTLPVTSSFAGRSAFLDDIPGSLYRDDGNAQLDLELIINQLDRLEQLKSTSSTQWPLLLLIDNALRFAKGYKPEETLKMVQQTLAEAYEKM
jgi:hypothetical protein